MNTTKPDMTGKVTNYDIAQATGLWAADVSLAAHRIGADEYCIVERGEDIDGRKMDVCREAYTLADALKIADFVKANPSWKKGGVHCTNRQAEIDAESRLIADTYRAFGILGL